MDTMPDRYETHETTTTTNTGQAPAGAYRIAVNLPYLKTLPGMLKMAEMVLDLIVIICVAAGYYWSYTPGGKYVTFVGAFGLITTIVFFLFHFLGIIYRLPGPWVLIEFFYLSGMSLFYLIAGIVSAADSRFGGSAIAAAIFCFVALVVHCVEIFLCFRVWRAGGGFYVASSGTGNATTATTTTVRTHEEYATSP